MQIMSQWILGRAQEPAFLTHSQEMATELYSKDQSLSTKVLDKFLETGHEIRFQEGC